MGICGLMPAKHGSAASYESGKCRCAECREAGMRSGGVSANVAASVCWPATSRSCSTAPGRPTPHQQVPVSRVPGVQIRLHEGVPSTTALGLRRVRPTCHTLCATFGDTGSADLCTARTCTSPDLPRRAACLFPEVGPRSGSGGLVSGANAHAGGRTCAPLN
jgi:hypothetical protein